MCRGASLRSSAPDVRRGYKWRARSELGGGSVGDRAAIGEDGEELRSESSGDGLRTGMDLSGIMERIALVEVE
jgi:hypothetical protein